jgi:hypothetical protein
LLLQGRCSAISGTVVEFPGAVVGDGVQILIFLRGFCRGEIEHNQTRSETNWRRQWETLLLQLGLIKGRELPFFLVKRENANSKWVVKVKSKKIKNSCYTREVRNMIKETAFCASVVGEKSTTFLLTCLFKKSNFFLSILSTKKMTKLSGWKIFDSKK